MSPKNHKRLSYAAIAAALALAKPGPQPDAGMLHAAVYTWKEATLNVADVLGAGNPRFNRKRFLDAAGVTA